MRLIIFITFLFGLASCSQDNQTNAGSDNTEAIEDTIIIKHQRVLNESYEVGFYSKSYYYNWVAGKDTVDFIVGATEHEKDSTLHLSIHHEKPMKLATVLNYINECLPLIQKDFNIMKFSSLYFQSPIYYTDLAKELSGEYEQKFGQKYIGYEKLNPFLLQSSINTRLDIFLQPLNKKVKRYSIEKFQIVSKESFIDDFPGIDFKDYPELIIHGIGIEVQLEEK